jgi:hypothetical protein
MRHVAKELSQLLICAYEPRSEACLEDVAAPWQVALVEQLRVATVEIAHPHAEIRGGGLDHEVEVVLHEAVAEAVPIVFLHGVPKQPKEGASILGVEEDRAAVVSSLPYVVDPAF